MDFFGIRCFVVSAKLQNFTQASKIMNISQPTLSRIISQMEQELNTTLFIRDKKGLRLSPNGKHFLEYAQNILNLYEKALSNSTQNEFMVKEKVSIAFHAYTVVDFLPKLVSYCEKNLPSIELELMDKERSEVLPLVYSGQADIGMCAYWGEELQLAGTICELFEDDYYIVLSKDHPLSNNDELDIRKLQSDTFFYCEHHDAYMKKELAGNYIGNQIMKEYKTDFSKRHHVNTINSMMVLLECHQGFSLLPEHCKRWAGDKIKFIKMKKGVNNSVPKFKAIYSYLPSNSNSGLTKVLEAIVNCSTK